MGTITGGTGAWQPITVQYTDLFGSGDIASGQVTFNSNTSMPACQIGWNSLGRFALVGGGGRGVLSSPSCSLDTGSSSITSTGTGANSGYNVTLMVMFNSGFYSGNTTQPIYASAESYEGSSLPQTNPAGYFQNVPVSLMYQDPNAAGTQQSGGSGSNCAATICWYDSSSVAPTFVF